jgi:flagellar biosynthetic protein FliR
MWAYALNHYPLALLVLLRVLAFVASSPLVSVRAWPIPAKLGLAAFVTLWTAPGLTAEAPDPFLHPGGYLLLALDETVVGMFLGFLATLVFSAISMAGQLFDVQVGFNMANLFDAGAASGSAQSAIGGMFLQVLFSLYYIALDGLDGLMLCVMESFRMVPLGGFNLPHDTWQFLTHLFGMVMAFAVQLAAPLLVALLLTDITFAFLSRAVPQMNVFVVGLPVKLFVGLAVFAAVMPGVVYLFGQLFGMLFSQLNLALQWLGG